MDENRSFFKTLLLGLAVWCHILFVSGIGQAFAVCEISKPGYWVLASTTHADCDNGKRCDGHWAYDTVDKVYFICGGSASQSGCLNCEDISGNKKIITTYGATVIPGYYWGVYHNHQDAPGQKAPLCSCPYGAINNGGSLHRTIAWVNQTFDWKCVSDLEITSFTGDKSTITASIIDSSGRPVSWALTINGKTYTGTGKSVNISWDGSSQPSGSYSATLNVKTTGGPASTYAYYVNGEVRYVTTDGTYTDSKTISITVVNNPPTKDTGSSSNNQVCLSSSGNLKSGNYYHSQAVISKPKSLLFELSYNSLDDSDLPIGKGWTHNYNLALKEQGGKVLLKLDDGDNVVFTPNSGSYLPETASGDTSVIIKNSDGTYTRTLKNGIVQMFTASGRLASISDRNGNTTALTYSGNDLTTITDATGRSLVLSYADGRLASVQDPAGRTTAFSHSGNLLTGITGPAGDIWQYDYDAAGKLVQKTDPAGNRSSNRYDAAGKLVASSDPAGQSKGISYNPANNVSNITDKDGGIWTQKYDPAINAATEKTDPSGNTRRYTYTSTGNILTSTDENGNVTSFTYDASGNMLSKTDANGNTTRYAYNNRNRITSVTDAANNITRYTYDIKDNLISITDPSGAVTSLQYDVKGNPVRITDPTGAVTVLGYDAWNNLITVTDPLGAITRYTYDAVGNRLSHTDPLGNTTAYRYDARDRLITITDPKGNSNRITYNLAGNRTGQTDANGNTVSYDHDPLGRPVTMTNQLGHATQFSYTSRSSLLTLTDPSSNQTRYEYDLLGRVTSETDPLGNVTRYGYDPAGRLVEKSDPLGAVIGYTYDGAGRLTRKSYPDGSSDNFTYDAAGNLTAASNRHISYTYGYDANRRLISAQDSLGRSIGYRYDAAGNRTALVLSDDATVSYGYDPAGRLTSLVKGGNRFTFGYDKQGNRTSLRYPGGTTTTYGYDESGNLTSINHPGIAVRSYTVDKTGNRIEVIEDRKQVTRYEYDAASQLIAATGRHEKELFVYDASGNRIAGPQAKTVYSVGPDNQLLTRDRQHKAEIDRKSGYRYDRNGNLVERTDYDHTGGIRQTVSYGYDAENRLVSVEILRDNRRKQVSFAYDPFGRRLEKTIRTDEIKDDDEQEEGTPRTVRYLYDHEDIIREYDSKGKVIATYLHGPGIDEPLAIETRHQTYFYHADGLGSVIALSDRHNRKAQEYDYDSFGSTKRHGNRVKQPYGYTGREWDKETGLYYYRARYYDPEAGRFISKDPIGFRGGDVNLYGYVQNNPVNWIDPLGLFDVNFSATFGGVELTAQIYNSDRGWLPSDKLKIGVTTTLVGAGFDILGDTSLKNAAESIYGKSNLDISVGLSRYGAVKYDSNLATAGVNIGLGLGSPVSFSTSIENFAKGIGNKLSNIFGNNKGCQ